MSEQIDKIALVVGLENKLTEAENSVKQLKQDLQWANVKAMTGLWFKTKGGFNKIISVNDESKQFNLFVIEDDEDSAAMYKGYVLSSLNCDEFNSIYGFDVAEIRFKHLQMTSDDYLDLKVQSGYLQEMAGYAVC